MSCKDCITASGPSEQCCDGDCVNTETDEENCGRCGNECPGDTEHCCKGSCAETQTDPRNCGECGHLCPGAGICSGGQCMCGNDGDCNPGETCCSGTCVNTETDRNNCGACGAQCDKLCGRGTCVGDCHTDADCGPEDEGEICINEVCECKPGWHRCTGGVVTCCPPECVCYRLSCACPD
jgi:hypothetical protein